MRTEEHIFDGSLTVECGLLVDNYKEKENSVEPGCNSEQDTYVICDNDSAPSPNTSCWNVEDIKLFANFDDHENNHS